MNTLNRHSMKTITCSLVVLFILCILVPPKSEAQGLIFTKAGDTIHYNKIEEDYPVYKYWVNDSEKPIKIKFSEVGNHISYPKYNLVIDKVDEFTGIKTRATGIIGIGMSRDFINGERVVLAVMFGKADTVGRTSYIIRMHTPAKIGCSGASDNYAMIKFADNDVIKLEKDIARVDCKQAARSAYVLRGETLDKIKKYEIKAIRFRQSEGFLDFDLLFPDALMKSLELIDK
jgi:hypothetical protein